MTYCFSIAPIVARISSYTHQQSNIISTYTQASMYTIKYTGMTYYTDIRVHIYKFYIHTTYTHNIYIWHTVHINTCICLADLDSTVMLPSASLHRLVYSSGLMDTFLSRARNLMYGMRCEVDI